MFIFFFKGKYILVLIMLIKKFGECKCINNFDFVINLLLITTVRNLDIKGVYLSS